ncbi:hypothetical protein [Mycobacterium montefiorense]|uniref:Uncharacterized protein n=1 Tax=Mycobacterium montefiorense TaxID=154654 RepID=A0AA37UUW9_9MYCO|nr:hypothetical protein [Mycobacterium montefiorense]GBG38787.1 hypothetical protein MmonteBS_31590 [Mycobacterium montefiorense]GKU34615.1 hypothetical protein NJB14191_19610 [Mycobacterium montefiorense]GKU38096.1 hypothetical protein NJB14192_00950 [Mycobacterium montefiorense]GKU43384.1 hypothetical protein NJB14194_00170 [Mycobacterium montefiorense]GKU50000.1 hypothetical protein NJB14195_12460 [Mycobacterium montefiorense]
MRQVTFKMVAAGDGSPPTSTGYCYYLMAHAVATVLLLITLVAAVWQFMDWVVTPSCLAASSVSTETPVSTAPVASSTAMKAEEIRNSPGQPGITNSTWTERPASYRNAARTETVAGFRADSGDCPCPKTGK